MKSLFVYSFLSIPLIGAFAMFALGISVIYRASRVLNLAHGAMAMVPAYLCYSLVTYFRAPIALALPVAVLTGAVLGVGVERIFVRRLRRQGPTAQTVGTVAVTGLLIALAAKVWGTTPRIAPTVFPEGELRVFGAAIRYGSLGLFVVGVVVSACLFAFFQFTEVGLAMRGAAQNRRAASLMGIDPDLAAAAAWALGGGLAALSGVLLAAVTNLDPYNLSLQVLPAFVAALIGGLESLPLALAGSAIVGFTFGLVPALTQIPFFGAPFRYSGAAQLVLTALALVVMATRGRRFSGSEAAEAGLTSGEGTVRLDVRRYKRLLYLVAVVGLPLPFVVPFSILGNAILAMELGLVAFSLVVLIGWVGQISLAQASFVGIAAFVTGLATRGFNLGFPGNLVVGAAAAALAAALLGAVALRVRGLYLAVATLIFAWMADQFLFRSPWLGAAGGSSTIPDQIVGVAGGYPSFDLTNRRTLYYVLGVIIVLVISALTNLRDTKTGRAFFAVRGSEMAAASLGIDVVRYKLIAFALAGALAGIGGSLLMVEQRTVVPTQFLFTVSLQYLAIAVVGGLGSLGGAVAAGVLFAGLNELFFQVRALSGWLEVVSAALLGVVLLVYPGGLAALPQTIRTLRLRPGPAGRFLRFIATMGLAMRGEAIVRLNPVISLGRRVLVVPYNEFFAWTRWAWTHSITSVYAYLSALFAGFRTRLSERVRRRRKASDGTLEAVEADLESTGPLDVEDAPFAPSESGGFALGIGRTFLATGPSTLHPDRSKRVPLLEADDVTVQFGGLVAVNRAHLSVRAGEIVGLIGPNGAGKTTLFNAILGLNSPTSGTIKLYGRDVTPLPPHLRSRIGVARTFQVIQLFNELTVFDNILVATHLHNRSGLFSNLAATHTTLRAEAAARARVREVIEILELDDVASSSVRGLPFGILRMVELGRALVTGAKLMMLDEPASGLNDAETDRLGKVVTDIRALGVSILLIEHDVRMVVKLCNYIHVLDQGVLISEGPPDVVQRDPKVIRAYLGGAPESDAPASKRKARAKA